MPNINLPASSHNNLSVQEVDRIRQADSGTTVTFGKKKYLITRTDDGKFFFDRQYDKTANFITKFFRNKDDSLPMTIRIIAPTGDDIEYWKSQETASIASSLTNMPPNRSIYSEENQNIDIDKLISSATATKKVPLNESRKNDLDALFTLAKNNDEDSIELLQNLSLSEGEIASYAQHLLCKLIAREDGTSYDAACSARSGCQKLITNFSGGVITNKILEDNPKLLLVAGSKIEGDGPHLELIPLQVKSKIKNFDNKHTKPQWWHETKLEDGQFETPKPSTIKNKDYWVKEHKLPDDGACQFRAAFTLRDKDDKWLSASKEDILNEVRKQNEPIKQSITTSFSYITEEAGLVIPKRFKGFFEQENFEEAIYNKTINSGDFNLYSPTGIASAISEFSELGPLLSKEEDTFLTMFSNSIGENLKNVFKLPLSSDDSKAYSVPTGNHYNIITPVEFFTTVD